MRLLLVAVAGAAAVVAANAACAVADFLGRIDQIGCDIWSDE